MHPMASFGGLARRCMLCGEPNICNLQQNVGFVQSTTHFREVEEQVTPPPRATHIPRVYCVGTTGGRFLFIFLKCVCVGLSSGAMCGGRLWGRQRPRPCPCSTCRLATPRLPMRTQGLREAQCAVCKGRLRSHRATHTPGRWPPVAALGFATLTLSTRPKSSALFMLSMQAAASPRSSYWTKAKPRCFSARQERRGWYMGVRRNIKMAGAHVSRCPSPS